MFYLFLFQIFSFQEQNCRFSIEACVSSALPVGPEHCFLKFLRCGEYDKSIGFYQNGGCTVALQALRDINASKASEQHIRSANHGVGTSNIPG